MNVSQRRTSIIDYIIKYYKIVGIRKFTYTQTIILLFATILKLRTHVFSVQRQILTKKYTKNKKSTEC